MAGGSVIELAQVIPGRGDPPIDIGTGHAMREVTEVVAADPAAWTPEMAARVGGFFDERAPSWSSLDGRTEVLEPLRDALDRGGPIAGPVLELGPGVGAGTSILAGRFDHVVAGDLSGEMLRRLSPDLAARAQLDASSLPIRSGSVGAVVCVNMLLFAGEVRRVLSDDGVLIWVNSIGECTPIHLPAHLVAEALGDGFEVTASRAGWGTWAVARRT